MSGNPVVLPMSTAITDDILARLATIVVWPAAAVVFDEIFGGATHEEKRAQLDDKTERNSAKWQFICDRYMNSALYAPTNDFTADQRYNNNNIYIYICIYIYIYVYICILY